VTAGALQAIGGEPLLGHRLAVKTAGVLAGGQMELRWDDPVGGGKRCAFGGCVRVRRTSEMCNPHHWRWHEAGQPDQARWVPGEPVLPDRINLTGSPRRSSGRSPTASTARAALPTRRG
jgi:hypothetical protein